MALPKNDSRVKVHSKGYSFRFPADVLASEVYTMLSTTDGPGLLFEPNGTIIDNKNSPVSAGNYPYILRSPVVVPQVTAERDSPSKRRRVADPVESRLKLAELADAMESYFERLLQPPEKLPDSDADLRKFLSHVPVKLPMLFGKTYNKVNDKRLVTLEHSEETAELASCVDFIVSTLLRNSSKHSREADSSADLRLATGVFLDHLDGFAPRERQLIRLEGLLDSSNLSTSKGSTKPLLHLRRPDFQVYVSNCLILRWENKSNKEDLYVAMKQNISKLRKWSPMYYGRLPYVIGGACAGSMFTWLRLFSTGERLDFGVISPRMI